MQTNAVKLTNPTRSWRSRAAWTGGHDSSRRVLNPNDGHEVANRHRACSVKGVSGESVQLHATYDGVAVVIEGTHLVVAGGRTLNTNGTEVVVSGGNSPLFIEKIKWRPFIRPALRGNPRRIFAKDKTKLLLTRRFVMRSELRTFVCVTVVAATANGILGASAHADDREVRFYSSGARLVTRTLGQVVMADTPTSRLPTTFWRRIRERPQATGTILLNPSTSFRRRIRGRSQVTGTILLNPSTSFRRRIRGRSPATGTILHHLDEC